MKLKRKERGIENMKATLAPYYSSQVSILNSFNRENLDALNRSNLGQNAHLLKEGTHSTLTNSRSQPLSQWQSHSKLLPRNPTYRSIPLTFQKIIIISRDNIRTLNPRSLDSIKKQHQLVPRPGRKRTPFDSGKEISLGEAGDYTPILKNSTKKAITLDLSEFEKVKNLSAFLSPEELTSRNEELNAAKTRTVADAKTRRVCFSALTTRRKWKNTIINEAVMQSYPN